MYRHKMDNGAVIELEREIKWFEVHYIDGPRRKRTAMRLTEAKTWKEAMIQAAAIGAVLHQRVAVWHVKAILLTSRKNPFYEIIDFDGPGVVVAQMPKISVDRGKMFKETWNWLGKPAKAEPTFPGQDNEFKKFARNLHKRTG